MYRLLLMLVLLACLGRLAMFASSRSFNPGAIFEPDSAGYIAAAKKLMGVGASGSDSEPGTQPRRTPGYPCLIAAVFSVCGERPAALVTLQLFLGFVTVFAAYILASRLFGGKAAALGALFLSLDLASAISSQQILSETLFTLMLALFVLTGAFAATRPQKIHFIFLSGFFLALAALTRPAAYYLFFVALVLFPVIWKRSAGLPLSKGAAYALLFALPWLALVGGWQFLEKRHTGSLEAPGQGERILFFYGASILAQRDATSIEEAQYRLGYGRYAEVHPESAGLPAGKLNEIWRREGMLLIRRHPGLFVKTQLKASLSMLFGPGEQTLLGYAGRASSSGGPVSDLFSLPPGEYLRRWLGGEPAIMALLFFALCHLAALYAGGFASVRFLLMNRENGLLAAHVLIWTVILYFALTSVGYSRFRVPIMPLLSVYAGHGWWVMLSRGHLGGENGMLR